MNKFPLPVIIHAKEGKEEKGYSARLRFVGERKAFIGRSILWIAFGSDVDCLRVGKCFA